MTDENQGSQAEAATIKRAIKMSMFGTASVKSRFELAIAQAKVDNVDPTTLPPITLGQLVGRIGAVEVKTIEHNGELSEIWQGVGEFEGVVYETGQVMESPTANLPRYYLEGVKAVLDSGAGTAVLCGIEIVLVATGKQIPVAYEVRNLIPREADHPLNRAKLAMQAAGKLRLPPPTPAAKPAQLGGEFSGDHHADDPLGGAGKPAEAREPTTSEKADVRGRKAPASA